MSRCVVCWEDSDDSEAVHTVQCRACSHVFCESCLLRIADADQYMRCQNCGVVFLYTQIRERAELSSRFEAFVDATLPKAVGLTMPSHVQAFAERQKRVESRTDAKYTALDACLQSLSTVDAHIDALLTGAKEDAFVLSKSTKGRFTREWLGYLPPVSCTKRSRLVHDEIDIVDLCENHMDAICKNIERFESDEGQKYRDRMEQFLGMTVEMECRGKKHMADLEGVVCTNAVPFYKAEITGYWSTEHLSAVYVIDPRVQLEIEMFLGRLLLWSVRPEGNAFLPIRKVYHVVCVCLHTMLHEIHHAGREIASFIFPPEMLTEIKAVSVGENEMLKDDDFCILDRYVGRARKKYGYEEAEEGIHERFYVPTSFEECLWQSAMQLAGGDMEAEVSIIRSMEHAIPAFTTSMLGAYRRKVLDQSPGYTRESIHLDCPGHVYNTVHHARMLLLQKAKKMTLVNEAMGIMASIRELQRFEDVWDMDQSKVECPLASKKMFDVIRCTNNACMGFVPGMRRKQTARKCVQERLSKVPGVCTVCSTDHCRQCWKVCQGDGTHTCAEEDLASVKKILSSDEVTQCLHCRTIHHRVTGCNEVFCLFCKHGFDFRTGEMMTNTDSPDWREHGTDDNFPIPWLCPPVDWNKMEDVWTKLEQIKGRRGSGRPDLVSFALERVSKYIRETWEHRFEDEHTYNREILWVRQKKDLMKLVLRTIHGPRNPAMDQKYEDVISRRIKESEIVQFLHVMYECCTTLIRVGDKVVAMAFDQSLYSNHAMNAVMTEFETMCSTWSHVYSELM